VILYIHGFSSHGYGGKAKALREYYRDTEIDFIAPSLSYVPDLAMQTLEELMGVCDDVKLIGSSLGGYYAIYLAEKYGLKAALINPAIHPYESLKRALGTPPNFFDGSHFEWRESHLEMLRSYETEAVRQENYLLLLQKGDEVLDYREAVEKLPGARHIIEEGGDHGFSGIEKYFSRIESFLCGE